MRGLAGRIRGVTLGIALAAGVCAGCATLAGGDGGYAVRDDAAARCERDHGAWRPLIAGGYCEHR